MILGAKDLKGILSFLLNVVSHLSHFFSPSLSFFFSFPFLELVAGQHEVLGR